MKNAHFDALVRALGDGATRRGVLAGVAGVVGLRIIETGAERRKRAERRTTNRNEGSGDLTAQKGSRAATAQTVTISEGCPKKPAASIAILSAFYPGYWWDHINLTVAVQAHPNADPALIAAVREAIVIWNDVLARAGALSIVTLTDVTDTQDPEHKADIVLHYVPDAGGTVFGGYAICGEHKCNNVLVRSDLPKPLDRDPYTAEYLGWVTLHELGHALGLGHAEPLEETNDLMGYGWPPLDPVLSPCDLRALEVVFAWAIAGDDPHPPTVASVDCSDLCKRRR